MLVHIFVYTKMENSKETSEVEEAERRLLEKEEILRKLRMVKLYRSKVRILRSYFRNALQLLCFLYM